MSEINVGRRQLAHSFLCATVFLFISLSQCKPQPESAVAFEGEIVSVPDPHGHPENPHLQKGIQQDLGEFMPNMPQLVANSAEINIKCQDAPGIRCEETVSENKTWRAVIIQESGLYPDETIRFYLKNEKTGQVYRVVGLPFPWAEISDPVWFQNRFLIFDRWHNNHFAAHFAIDLKKPAFILAASAPDMQLNPSSLNPAQK